MPTRTDPDAYHCEMADRSFPLNGTGLYDTYLDIEKIISIALTGRCAGHPSRLWLPF